MGFGSGGGYTPSANDVEGGFRATGSLIQLSSSVIGLNGTPTGSAAGPGSFLSIDPDGTIVLDEPAGGGGAVSSYTNAADNRVITSVDSSTINGEANLAFDGSTLTVTGVITGSSTVSGLGITGTSLELQGGGVTNAGAVGGATSVSGSDVGTFVGGLVTEAALNVSGNATLGDTSADVVTVTGQLTASQGARFSGKVGIGTDAPAFDLHVKNDSSIAVIDIEPASGNDAIIRLFAGASPAWQIQNDATNGTSNKFVIRDSLSPARNVLIFEQGSPDNLIRGNAAGNLGINTATPTEQLSVNGTFGVTGSITAKSTVSGSGVGTFVGGLITEGNMLITGSIGIDTDSPSESIDVVDGNVLVSKHESSPGPRSKYITNRSRGSATSPTAVASGDSISTMEFNGHDGTSYIPAAEIEIQVAATVGTSAVPGNILFHTRPSGSSDDPTTHMQITHTGSVVIGKEEALETSSTDGFLYVPTTAGAPTGTPTAFTGKVPLVFDTSNNDLYVHDGGWIKVTLT